MFLFCSLFSSLGCILFVYAFAASMCLYPSIHSIWQRNAFWYVRCLFMLKWYSYWIGAGMFLNILDSFRSWFFHSLRTYILDVTFFVQCFGFSKKTKSHQLYNTISKQIETFFSLLLLLLLLHIVKFWRIIYHTLGTFYFVNENKDIYPTQCVISHLSLSIFYVFIVDGYVVPFIPINNSVLWT